MYQLLKCHNFLVSLFHELYAYKHSVLYVTWRVVSHLLPKNVILPDKGCYDDFISFPTPSHEYSIVKAMTQSQEA